MGDEHNAIIPKANAGGTPGRKNNNNDENNSATNKSNGRSGDNNNNRDNHSNSKNRDRDKNNNRDNHSNSRDENLRARDSNSSDSNGRRGHDNNPYHGHKGGDNAMRRNASCGNNGQPSSGNKLANPLKSAGGYEANGRPQKPKGGLIGKFLGGFKKNIDDATNEGKPDGQGNDEGEDSDNPDLKDSPIGRAAGDLGKKTLKDTAKVAAPGLAAAYGIGKLFYSMKNAFGMFLNNVVGGLQAAVANSPIAHALDFAHNMIQGAGNLLGNIGSAIGNIGNMLGHGAAALGHGISNIMGGIVHGVGSMIHGIANTIGISTAHAATLSFTAIALVGGGGILGIVQATMENIAVRDANQPDDNCKALVDSAQDGAAKTDTSGSENKQAEEIYHVLSAYGLDDNAIAGVLGCFTRESHLDPTAVEGIFDEPYTYGPKKRAAMEHLASYTSKVSTGSSQYTNGGACPGIGLGQWTGGNGLKLLAAAKKMGKPWYTLEVQLAYLLSTPTPTGMPAKQFWQGMEKANSANAAVDYFLTHWEGVPGNAEQEREGYAHHFKQEFSKWGKGTKDDPIVKSVISLAGEASSSATEAAVNSAAASCAQAQMDKMDNSSSAKAALSYAWDNEQLATGNNGTQLYQKVHDGIFPGDPYYKSCDRNVAMAMRWSGTDINYPIGPTTAQLQYLKTSHKWKRIGSTSSFDYKKLQPGDVMVKDGHTYLYVGHDMIKKSIMAGEHKASRVPANADDVDASYGERSAGIGIEARYSIIDHGDGPYDIFRCVKPDHSSKYKSIGVHTDNHRD